MMTEKEDMKTKKGFKLRTVCGENIIVAEGIENVDFSRIISMNETSAYLWKNIQGIDFDENTLAGLLLAVSKSIAVTFIFIRGYAQMPSYRCS